MRKKLTIALAGSPNSGKTAIFNRLTGTKQKVANYPGVTVERKSGHIEIAGHDIELVDLPGTYSLDAKTLDEKVTKEVLYAGKGNPNYVDLIIAVVDATQLERSLALVLELRDLNKPMIICLNMMDIVARVGLDINLKSLSRELKHLCVSSVATRKDGLDELKNLLAEVLETRESCLAQDFGQHFSGREHIKKRFKEVDRILLDSGVKTGKRDVFTDRIDRFVLHPVLGYVILVALMIGIFQAVFNFAEAPMEWIEGGIEWLAAICGHYLPDGLVKSLILDGVIAGVGSVLVFLPQILILFLCILFLEDFGYMARAAYLMDRAMAGVGLHGRSFLPLLSSFACAIPGIMATRTIENKKDRFATMMIAPLMTCSARLPVYALLIAAFIPNIKVYGFGLQGLTMFSLYVCGIAFGVLVALVLKKTALRGPKSSFVLELPSYKIPTIENLFLGLFQRAKIFVSRAGKLIFIVSVVLWILSSFPKAPDNYEGTDIEYSYAGQIGMFFEPALAPIGFDWRIATGLIPGFAAREVMVGALATVFAVEESEDEEEVEKSLSEKISSTWGIPTGLALLAWYVFSPQCLATIAVARREMNSWAWAGGMFLYMLVLAYVMAFLCFRVATALVS